MEIDKRAYSGAIYDIMKFDMGINENFVLPNDIIPLYTYLFDYKIFGKAFTARGDKTPTPDHKIVADMIDEMSDGDIYILQANDNSRAHFGDIMGKFLISKGVQGAILQGWTRDKAGLTGIPVWCKGVQPQDSADRWGITHYLHEIVIGNIFITPADYVFADMDGILIIRENQVKEVLERLPEKLDYEDQIRAEITRGKSAGDIYTEKGRW